MKRLSAFLASLLSLGFIGMASMAQLNCAPTVPKFEFKYAEKRAVLPNGLKLVVIPDRNTQMAQVNVRYEVGSNEDPKGKRGLAHLVEHMMFEHRFAGKNGPKTFEMLPQISPGGFNAYTIWEKTHYHLMARADDVEDLLRLEAGRLNSKCKFLDESDFPREREVVRNEIRQRFGGPQGQVLQLMLKAAYPPGHAYYEFVGGDDKQVSSITFKEMCKFFDDYYTPDRATVVVVGNVDPDRIGKLVVKYFSGIEKGNAAPRKRVVELPPFKKYSKIEYPVNLERTQVAVIWRMPALYGSDSAKISVMASSMNARLQRFREDWDFAVNVGAGMFNGGGAFGPVYSPIFTVNMELYKYDDLDKALNYVWKAADGVHQGLSGDGFDEKSRNLAKAGLILGLESIAARADHVADLIQFEKDVDFGSNKEFLFHELEAIDKIDADGFKGFAKGRLSKNHATVIVFKASKDGIQGDARSAVTFNATAHARESNVVLNAAADAAKPLPVPTSKSVLGRTESYTLSNGMKVMLLALPDGMPIITASLVFGVGSVHESPADAGLASLAAGFRNPPRDSDFWTTGVRFSSRAGANSTRFSARGISLYLDVALKGIERIVKAGYVDQKQIESYQKRMKTALASELSRQRRAFDKEFAAALFGDAHPYTTTGSVTESSLAKMGRDRLNSFARKHYSAGNSTLIVVGKFEVKAAKKLIEDSFGDWDKGHVDPPVTTATPTRSGPIHFGVIGQKLPQVEVRFGYPGPAGRDSQYAARLVLSRMLGKRMGQVRATLGSTYGINAGWRASIGPSAYFVGGTIDAPRAGETVKFMRKMLDELRSGKNFAADFAEARRATLKALLAESSETFPLVQRLASLALFGKQPGSHDELTRQVAVLTIDAVKQVIVKDLDPNNEIIAALGDRESLEKMFTEAGLNNARFIEPK